MKFLHWAYNIGVANPNNKMSADTAVEVMALVGTFVGEQRYTTIVGVDPYMKANGNGKPTFRLWEQLDSWKVKPWFSQEKSKFNKKIKEQLQAAKAAKASESVGAAIDTNDIDIDLDIED